MKPSESSEQSAHAKRERGWKNRLHQRDCLRFVM